MAEIYGKQRDDRRYYLNHRAYIKVPTTGDYTFELSNVDDHAAFWVGGQAYLGYVEDSANERAQYVSSPASANYSTVLTAGTYVPLRVWFRQDGGASSFKFNITEPDGSQLPDDNIVQYGCSPDHNEQAPAFSNFGSES